MKQKFEKLFSTKDNKAYLYMTIKKMKVLRELQKALDVDGCKLNRMFNHNLKPISNEEKKQIATVLMSKIESITDSNIIEAIKELSIEEDFKEEEKVIQQELPLKNIRLKNKLPVISTNLKIVDTEDAGQITPNIYQVKHPKYSLTIHAETFEDIQSLNNGSHLYKKLYNALFLDKKSNEYQELLKNPEVEKAVKMLRDIADLVWTTNTKQQP